MNNLIFVFIKKISLHFPQNGVNDVDRHLLMHLEIVPFFYLPLLILLPLVNLVVISFRSRGRDDLILSFAFQLHTLWEEANIRSNKKKTRKSTQTHKFMANPSPNSSFLFWVEICARSKKKNLLTWERKGEREILLGKTARSMREREGGECVVSQ